jgi:hypothetical protein
MFAVIAAILFAIGFIVHGGAYASTNTWLDWTSLMLAGLFFAALHLVFGTGVPFTIRRRP